MEEARHKRPQIVGFQSQEMGRKGKTVETQSRLVVAWDWRLEWGLTVDSDEGSYWGDRNVLTMDCSNNINSGNLSTIINCTLQMGEFYDMSSVLQKKEPCSCHL